MSFQAMAWAVKQKTDNSGQKLVLLMLSNYCNSHTGQCNPSHKTLAEECSMGISTLKGHLSALQDAGFIEIIHKSVDSVALPNQYVLKLDGVGQNLADGGSESGLGVGQNLATNLEVKPINEPKLTAAPDGFAEFWSAYPRKVAKGNAEKAWKKHKPPLAACIAAIAKSKNSAEWQKDGGQFIPHPATWINGKRWEDEDSVKPVAGGFIDTRPDWMRAAI